MTDGLVYALFAIVILAVYCLTAWVLSMYSADPIADIFGDIDEM